MSETRDHHVTIRFNRDYQFVAEFDDCVGAPELLLDEPEPLGDGIGPNAATVLGAAIGNCLAASFTFGLRKSRADIADFTAHVVTHVRRNEQGRFRIAGIDVDLQPVLASDEPDRLARCTQLFEDFCVVTESVRRGIPVSVKVAPRVAATQLL